MPLAIIALLAHPSASDAPGRVDDESAAATAAAAVPAEESCAKVGATWQLLLSKIPE
jgi:hypothetical protein